MRWRRQAAKSLMFARICFQSVSIGRLCPQIKDEKDIWDFTSIAVLARSLFEAIMFFEYFCDSKEPDEWLTKMLLMHFHDRCERVRFFTELKKPDDVAGFSGEREVLQNLLSENAFFRALEVSRQKELLNGFNPAILTLRQMADKYAQYEEDSMIIYQSLSNNVHPYPFSFLRNDDTRRDGLQNDKDKMYIPGVLTWIAALLDKARESYLQILDLVLHDGIAQTSRSYGLEIVPGYPSDTMSIAAINDRVFIPHSVASYGTLSP
jgi:hypothetical protein